MPSVLNQNDRVPKVALKYLSAQKSLRFVAFLGSFSCEDRPDGYYANPSDCSKYYRCVVGNKYAFKCPAGLKFNDKIDVCDWPENVKCPKRNKVLFKGRKRRKGRKAV